MNETTTGGWPDDPPYRPRPVVSWQTWRDVVFLHWPYPPEAVRPLLPRGTRLDLWDGVAWVGVIGLRMTDVTVGALPSPPYLGDFGELNVRTYTVGADGRRGTAFLTMEAARLAMPLLARPGLCIPYTWAAVRFSRRGDLVGYRTRRFWPAPRSAGVRLAIRPGDPRQADPLERFCVNRWALHTSWYRRPLTIPFAHERWPLRSAELAGFADAGLLAAAGLPAPTGPPVSVLYAPVVHGRMGVPELSGSRSAAG